MRTGRPKGIVNPVRDVACVICGTKFQTRHSQGRYCSPECRRKGHQKSWRDYGARNVDARRELHKAIYRRDPAKKAEKVAAYLTTERGKEVRAKTGRNARAKHPEKVAARQAVADAIKAGTLVRQPCERCGATPADAHHPDYSQPLLVEWLCRPHHREVHGRNAAR